MGVGVLVCKCKCKCDEKKERRVMRDGSLHKEGKEEL